jgi:sarcosine oxidase gamma subunit
VLTVSPPEVTETLRAELERAASAVPFASVVELTTALGSNAVVGPLARETFARSTALDMRPERFEERAFAPVSVARTPGMVLRQGEDRFLHLFGSGFADYTWTVFIDAAEHLGGRGVGVEALGASIESGVKSGA